jgi:heavy metal sensor kinase
MTAFTFVVIGVTVAAAFVWSMYNLRAELEVRNDLFLRRELIEFVDTAQRSLGDPSAADPLAELRADAKVHEEAGLFVVVHHDGVMNVLPDNRQSRPFVEKLQTSDLGDAPRTIRLDDVPVGIRAMRREFSFRDSGNWTIDLCLNLTETEQTISSFQRRLAGGGAAFLAVAALAGWFVTRQALRPVAASIRSAQQLNPNDLSVRLPRTGAGDELDLLAATINDLLERLAHYHEQVFRFTADASHELRGPLAAMRAGVEVVLQQPRSADEYRESLETLGEQCQHLTDLVNKLLLLTRADAGQIQLEREPVDLAALVAEAVETYQPLADEKRVGLEWMETRPVWCPGDRMRLSQLIMNLLDNAIKYSRPEGTVRLALEPDGTMARLTVEDTGIGITADRLPHIFDRFYQGDQSRSEGGSGLGLNICHWVAAAHYGAIDVASEPGRGIGNFSLGPRVCLGAAFALQEGTLILALLARVAAGDGVLDAVRHVVAQHLLLDPPQRRAHRRQLGDDVDAVSVLVDHAPQTAHLALDAAQALQAGRLGFVTHA